MKKIMLFGLTCISMCWSQTTGQNVVINTMYSQTLTVVANGGTAIVTIPTTYTQNIGQTNHTVLIAFQQKTGSSALTNASANGFIVGSSQCAGSGAVGTDIEPAIGPLINTPLTSLNNALGNSSLTYYMYGYGAWSCNWVHLNFVVQNNSVVNVNVTVTVTYVGSSQPSNLLTDNSARFMQPVASIAAKLTTDNAVHNLLIDPALNFSFSGGNTLVIYGMNLDVDGTQTEFLMGCSSALNTITKTLGDIRNFNKGSITWAQGFKGYGFCNDGAYNAPDGGYFNYKIDGATATLNIFYRWE